MPDNLLEVKNLVTCFKSSTGPLKVLDGVSFSIEKGKVLGVVGESGCGKSVTSLSIMRLLPQPNGYIESGEILLDGTDLATLSQPEMESIRGRDVSMIFQEPMTALNPVFTIGDQIGEVLEVHRQMKRDERRSKSIELLKLVGIPRPEKIVDEYPHQLSGGMRQRVMIAMAMSCSPKLLIADEPTTALDVTIQVQILELMKSLKTDLGTAIMFITHDLGVVAEMADEVAVMYLGRIVEYAPAEKIYESPLHPYTAGLLQSRLVHAKKGDKLTCIPGMVPSLGDKPTGCAFSPRCPKCLDICREKMPELNEVEPKHRVRCWLYD